MIVKFLFILAFFILGISFLIPTDATLWRAFVSEYFVFLAIFFLLISFSFKKIYIPFTILLVNNQVKYTFNEDF